MRFDSCQGPGLGKWGCQSSIPAFQTLPLSLQGPEDVCKLLRGYIHTARVLSRVGGAPWMSPGRGLTCKPPMWPSGSSFLVLLGPRVPFASEMPVRYMTPGRWDSVGTVPFASWEHLARNALHPHSWPGCAHGSPQAGFSDSVIKGSQTFMLIGAEAFGRMALLELSRLKPFLLILSALGSPWLRSGGRG